MPAAEMWTTTKVLDWTAQHFTQKQIASPRLDAELLLAHVLGLDRIALYTSFEKPLDPGELAVFRGLVKRRAAGEPLAYLTGVQEFWSLSFFVDARVLIPRADTETLVEVAIELARAINAKRIADIATGSGAVAAALATELADTTVVATDIIQDALDVARKNFETLQLIERITVSHGDGAAAVAEQAPFDLIVSNPPYVRTADIDQLSAEARSEPRTALDGGADGLSILRELVPDAAKCLRSPGALAVEHAHDQGANVRALFSAAGYIDIKTVPDLAKNDRVTHGHIA